MRLEQSLKTVPLNTEAFLASLRRLRRATSGHFLTDADLARIKNAGRP